MNRLCRRSVLKISAAASVALAARGLPAAPRVRWPFYVFDNGVAALGSMAEKCRLLKELGYDGMELRLNAPELPTQLEQLDKHGLRAVALYAPSWLEEPLAPELTASIKMLKGRDTRIELPLRSRKGLKPSDRRGDKQAVAMLRAASDLCGDAGPAISIYPHAGFWTERVEDGLRLAAQLDRANVGTNFNLVHWQWAKPSPPLAELLAGALPHLKLVTINGLKGPADTRQQIRPLDDSDYDLAAFLQTLAASGYQGSVGLQCYQVAEPPRDHLARSMAVWRKLASGR